MFPIGYNRPWRITAWFWRIFGWELYRDGADFWWWKKSREW